jgi:hypothetical protein
MTRSREKKRNCVSEKHSDLNEKETFVKEGRMRV